MLQSAREHAPCSLDLDQLLEPIEPAMRVLLLGPYPPPHGGVQTNLVAIRSFFAAALHLPARSSTSRAIADRTPRRSTIRRVPSHSCALLARLTYDVIHLHIGGMLTNRLLSLTMPCTMRPGSKSVMTFHSGGFPSTPEGRSPWARRPFVPDADEAHWYCRFPPSVLPQNVLHCGQHSSWCSWSEVVSGRLSVTWNQILSRALKFSSSVAENWLLGTLRIVRSSVRMRVGSQAYVHHSSNVCTESAEITDQYRAVANDRDATEKVLNCLLRRQRDRDAAHTEASQNLVAVL